jgi:hypothetical protein
VHLQHVGMDKNCFDSLGAERNIQGTVARESDDNVEKSTNDASGWTCRGVNMAGR